MNESMPLFASSREALAWAANNSKSQYQQPVMTVMMNLMTKANKDAEEVQRGRRSSAMRGYSQLDRAGQAGLILQLLCRLPELTIHALLCAVLQPSTACTCRAPCCRGWRQNNDWLVSLSFISTAVYSHQLEMKSSGKKGREAVVTPHNLRETIVRQFFDRADKTTQESIAEHLGLTRKTVGEHQKTIKHHLVGLVRSGFTDFDHVLVDAGIVGAID